MLPAMPPPAAVQAEIDLSPLKYQSSLQTYRSLLEAPSTKTPSLLIGLRTPKGDVVELQVRHEDAYVIGFKGADQWYGFDDQKGGWGPPCGVNSNYNQLGKVGNVRYDDLQALGDLAKYKKGSGALDKRLCAILFAVTSEAARSATVATYFTGLTNSVGTTHAAYLQGGVDFEFLRTTYFLNWANPPEVEMELGKVYHFSKNDTLVQRYRK
jgi:hypothetical protein